jgi:hypothetical protein
LSFADSPLTIRATDQFYFQLHHHGTRTPCRPSGIEPPSAQPPRFQSMVHVKIDLVTLGFFSSKDPSPRTPVQGLFIVVTRSLVPHFHFRPIKNPPSIATGGFQNRFVFTHLHGRSLRDAKAILAAFSNAFNKHMFSCEFHLQCLSLFSTLCISYTMLFMSCQQFFFFLVNYFWCPRRDSNPHAFRQKILSLPRLPFHH